MGGRWCAIWEERISLSGVEWATASCCHATTAGLRSPTLPFSSFFPLVTVCSHPRPPTFSAIALAFGWQMVTCPRSEYVWCRASFQMLWKHSFYIIDCKPLTPRQHTPRSATTRRFNSAHKAVTRERTVISFSIRCIIQQQLTLYSSLVSCACLHGPSSTRYDTQYVDPEAQQRTISYSSASSSCTVLVTSTIIFFSHKIFNNTKHGSLVTDRGSEIPSKYSLYILCAHVFVSNIAWCIRDIMRCSCCGFKSLKGTTPLRIIYFRSSFFNVAATCAENTWNVALVACGIVSKNDGSYHVDAAKDDDGLERSSRLWRKKMFHRFWDTRINACSSYLAIMDEGWFRRSQPRTQWQKPCCLYIIHPYLIQFAILFFHHIYFDKDTLPYTILLLFYWLKIECT